MRVNKNFTIETNFIDELKKYNASELINELLDEYFNTKIKQNSSKIKAILLKKQEEYKKIRKEIKNLRLELSQIEQKEKATIELIKQYPKEIIHILNNFENSVILFSHYRVDNRLREYSYSELKKIWEKLKGGGIK